MEVSTDTWDSDIISGDLPPRGTLFGGVSTIDYLNKDEVDVLSAIYGCETVGNDIYGTLLIRDRFLHSPTSEWVLRGPADPGSETGYLRVM